MWPCPSAHPHHSQNSPSRGPGTLPGPTSSCTSCGLTTKSRSLSPRDVATPRASGCRPMASAKRAEAVLGGDREGGPGSNRRWGGGWKRSPNSGPGVLGRCSKCTGAHAHTCTGAAGPEDNERGVLVRQADTGQRWSLPEPQLPPLSKADTKISRDYS